MCEKNSLQNLFRLKSCPGDENLGIYEKFTFRAVFPKPIKNTDIGQVSLSVSNHEWGGNGGLQNRVVHFVFVMLLIFHSEIDLLRRT